ncbi:MAG: hypothetical protein WC484_06525 [Candidatus Omnitrophota bacterium]
MGKSPAFQFYPNDWSRDLEEHPLEIEGAWIRILCKLWWSETRGQMTKTLDQWARILREKNKKTEKILQYFFKNHIADGQYLDNQNITIISRRMVRDFEISKIRQEVGKLGGNPGLKKIRENLDNQNESKSASLLLQSSSSTSIKDKRLKDKKTRVPALEKALFLDDVRLTDKQHAALFQKFGEADTQRAIEYLNNYKQSHGKKYDSDYHTILNWVIERVRENGNRPGITGSAGASTPKAGRAQSDGEPYPVDLVVTG